MRKECYWIEGPWPGRLAILPRPRGGEWLEDDVHAWQQVGLDGVVSLLTREEITDLDLAQEERFCQANGIQFVSFPIVDRGTPASRGATFDLVRKLDGALAEGKNLALHCRQGIGRSALIAACLLVPLRVVAENYRVGIAPELARALKVPADLVDLRWSFARVHGDI